MHLQHFLTAPSPLGHVSIYQSLARLMLSFSLTVGVISTQKSACTRPMFELRSYQHTLPERAMNYFEMYQ